MQITTDDILQHHGVKGMKWGVRKTISAHVDSKIREHTMKKVLKDVNNLTTKQLQVHGNRQQRENNFKRLSKQVGSKKDKQDYLMRAKMGDEELNRKVARLQAISNIHKNAENATKSQIDFGKKVAMVAGPLVLQYALTKNISGKDIFESAVNSGIGGSKTKVLQKMVKEASKSNKNKG